MVLTTIVLLRFENRNAMQSVISFNVDKSAVGDITAWYGAFHAGDDYTVFVDGKSVEKDDNGVVSI